MASTKKFVEALDILENERGIQKEIVLDALKEALEKSYKKNYLTPDSVVRVDINPKTAKIRLFELKTIVEEVEDPDLEISLEEARLRNSHYEVGDVYETEVSPDIFGRLAATQTKQILRQKIREAEKESLFKEYADKKDDIITGIVDRVEERFAIINIGKTGAFLAKNQQIPHEKLVEGQHIKVYVSEVDQNTKGTHIVVSRSHPGLVKRLFELEVPEIYDGTVEIVSVSREAGERSKIAVTTKHEGVDAIGACVGPKGSRVRNVVNELHGEMIDIVEWSSDPVVFIEHALSPAHTISVSILNEKEKMALAIVPDNQLSLAIGKRAQNVRLAVHLTDWKIDIKSLSEAKKDGSYVEPVQEETIIDEDFQQTFEKIMTEPEVEEVVDTPVEEVEVLSEVVEEIKEQEDVVVDEEENTEDVSIETTMEENEQDDEDEEDDEDYDDDDDEWDDDEYDRYDEEIDYDAYDEYYDN